MLSGPRESGSPGGRRHPIRNVATNWGAFVILAAIGFFLSPFVVHRLGNEAYGVWVLLGSLVGYLGLLDLGVRSAVTKYVATHHAAARHDEASGILSAALVFFLAAGLVVTALGLAFAWLGLSLFEIPPELAQVARLVLAIAGVNVAVSLVGGVFGGAVVGLQRFDVVNGIGVVDAALRALAVVAVLLAGGGLVGLALVNLTASLGNALAMAWASRRVYPELRLRLRGWTTHHLRSLVSFGFLASLLHVSAMLANYSDSVVIGLLLPVGQITFFAIAASLMDYSRQLVRGIAHVMSPLAGALEGRGREDAVPEALVAGARVASLVSLPIVVTFILRGSSFVGLWMGPEYAGPTGLVLAILACGRWVAAGFSVASSTLMGVNKHGGLVPAFLIEAAANVALSVALAGPLGITGVALGTAIPRIVVSLGFGPGYVRSAVGLPARRYVMTTLVRPSFAMIPFAVASGAIELGWPAANLFVYFGQILLALPLAALGAWFVAFDGQERRDLARKLGRA